MSALYTLYLISDHNANCLNTYLMSSHSEAIVGQMSVFRVYTNKCVRTYQSKQKCHSLVVIARLIQELKKDPFCAAMSRCHCGHAANNDKRSDEGPEYNEFVHDGAKLHAKPVTACSENKNSAIQPNVGSFRGDLSNI